MDEAAFQGQRGVRPGISGLTVPAKGHGEDLGVDA